MSKFAFKNLEELKGIVQMIEKTNADYIPFILDQDSLKIQMINSSTTVYFSVELKEELFHYLTCKERIQFSVPSQFFCNYILKTCQISSELTVELKKKKVLFTTYKKGSPFTSSIPLTLCKSTIEFQQPKKKGDARITMKTSELIKSVKVVAGMDQPQISFKIHKNGKYEIIGSGNSIYQDSIQYFNEDGVLASINLKETFNTSALLSFICVSPPLDYITILFYKSGPTYFQYHNALLDIVVVISKMRD
ncbi:hypothetical protein ENUP19_0038G0007 [Entamoeba nuttalli]|uniref:Proliferating cell nuclear antigen n=2 Tax=Entamoeba nuttalli TaxID=412467 RepID=K2GY61_ENTNP|nr:hypothetical protein ENU1_154470 [Entamoeba nuttalli P19]EKE38752.1 hypothetical protein ENU1_154470 [Entamoeba nuttalli P19]|eukprot:XP_008858910.1 hypothetical protein ENU1_154470 [Entamoeba nuttalli P19]